jgi:L-asparaginase
MQEKGASVRPRIIIHGGAGNITRDNLPPKAYNAYRDALLSVLNEAHARLRCPGATALDVATFAVSRLEDNGLFNAGHGAVFTTNGTHELEASVMVSRGYRKRGVGIMGVKRAKNPILVAREMLVKGEEDNGGGAQGHCQLHGATVDDLTEQWGLDTVPPSYFWVRRRWIEHRRGLGKKHDDDTYRKHKRRADEKTSVDREEYDQDELIDGPGWDGMEYLPQGTVGAVVLDSYGTICTATSTGGLTNKLPGRIGDTPTLGAGFWGEQWTSTSSISLNPPAWTVSNTLSSLVRDCLPGLSGYVPLHTPPVNSGRQRSKIRAVAMSGTGNGDSFLRLSAVRTAAAMARFKSQNDTGEIFNAGDFPLQYAVTAVAGPGGLLQQSAEDRWQKTGEGEGGIIGIDLEDGIGSIVYDYNCGGMFHSWVDDDGKPRFQVFRDKIDV